MGNPSIDSFTALPEKAKQKQQENEDKRELTTRVLPHGPRLCFTNTDVEVITKQSSPGVWKAVLMKYNAITKAQKWGFIIFPVLLRLLSYCLFCDGVDGSSYCDPPASRPSRQISHCRGPSFPGRFYPFLRLSLCQNAETRDLVDLFLLVLTPFEKIENWRAENSKIERPRNDSKTKSVRALTHLAVGKKDLVLTSHDIELFKSQIRNQSRSCRQDIQTAKLALKSCDVMSEYGLANV